MAKRQPPLTRIQVGTIEHMIERSKTLAAAAASLCKLTTSAERSYAYALACRKFNCKLTELMTEIERLELGDDEE